MKKAIATRTEESSDWGKAPVAVKGIGFTLGAILIIASVILESWVLVYLWGWFVVPVLNVLPLTPGLAMGMILLARLVIPPTITANGTLHMFTLLYVRPLSILCIAWLVHTYLIGVYGW